MTTHAYTAQILWRREGDFAGNTYSRGHLWRFDGGVEVPASASPQVVPPPRSREDAIDPEEAFVASLASCHMLWFLDFARRAGLVVAAYEDAAEAEMGRIAPGRLAITKVTLHPRVTLEADALPEPGVLAELHEKAHAACFIANSVTSEVVVDAPPATLARGA